MTISEMIIPMSGGDMYAVHTVVPGAEKKPLVILCHGLMMNCALNPICGVAECLSMAGYDTIRFDFRGSGRSRGDITKMTPLTESADLLDIIRYACSIVNADRKIVLCGHSLGGLVSLLTAAGLYGAGGGPAAALTQTEREALKSRIAGLALLAPAVNAEADSCAGKVGLETFDPDNIPDLSRSGALNSAADTSMQHKTSTLTMSFRSMEVLYALSWGNATGSLHRILQNV